METLSSTIGEGLDSQRLSFLQILLRAILVFFAALSIVRVADKRFFAKKNAFDLILGFILGSMLARSINGSEKLIPTIAAGYLLALLHRFIGWLACRNSSVGGWIKGHSQILVRDGRVDTALQRKHHIADDDLMEDLRLKGFEALDEVKLARLERNGDLSVIKK